MEFRTDNDEDARTTSSTYKTAAKPVLLFQGAAHCVDTALHLSDCVAWRRLALQPCAIFRAQVHWALFMEASVGIAHAQRAVAYRRKHAVISTRDKYSGGQLLSVHGIHVRLNSAPAASSTQLCGVLVGGGPANG
jgi:hypothetical protein